jgi:type II secretory pathway component GspD/PulD (secretin)
VGALGVGWLLAEVSFAVAPSPPAQEKSTLIQIGVEVVEVDESKTHQLGVDWMHDLNLTESSVPSIFKVGAFTRSAISADIHFLLQEGAADLLANPKIVTRDGTTATFHAGGEIPYAASGSLGTVNVEFKPYGVNLRISPHVTEQGKIALSVDAEVSGPDQQNSVTLSGNVVPGIRSRQLNSQLTMDPGSTLTLAGLIQNEKQSTRTGIPGLMHIPLLGRLFSYKSETVQRTSIVVFITPTILAGVEPAKSHSTNGFLGNTGISQVKPAEAVATRRTEPSDALLEAITHDAENPDLPSVPNVREEVHRE